MTDRELVVDAIRGVFAGESPSREACVAAARNVPDLATDHLILALSLMDARDGYQSAIYNAGPDEDQESVATLKAWLAVIDNHLNQIRHVYNVPA